MLSAVFEGEVRHRRFLPAEHSFRYSVFMMYLDLDELPSLFARRWLWSNEGPNLASFRRADHWGSPGVPLAEAVRALVQDKTGVRPGGPIRLLTHLRYFGYGFNPVSFYYCFDRADRRLETIVAEVSNTPWGELHCYVLDEGRNAGSEGRRRFRFAKEFHVSPFMGMDAEYDWSFTPPGSRLAVHMASSRQGRKFFDATMSLARREIDGGILARTLLSYPLMTAQVVAGIHWQALRLWVKRCPVYTHPRHGLSAESL